MAAAVESNEKKFMVAIDESECSHHALNWTLTNLRDSLTSPLVLYTVQPLSSLAFLSAASMGAAPAELIQSVAEHQKKVSMALLEKAKEICAQHGVVAETVTEVGDPKEAICDAVEKFKINLLILGNHGRGAFQRSWSLDHGLVVLDQSSVAGAWFVVPIWTLFLPVPSWLAREIFILPLGFLGERQQLLCT